MEQSTILVPQYVRKLRVKKLDPSATLPTRPHKTDAGLDIYLLRDCYLRANQSNILSTGLAFEIPSGHFGLLLSRSSTAMKYGMANIAGVIDSDYRGEVRVVVTVEKEYMAHAGDRIAQLIIVPIPDIQIEEAQELSETQRGSGGFGSSGK